MQDYELTSLSVEVYENNVGVAHYVYRAVVGPEHGAGQVINGRWNEVYLKQDGAWLMISLSGKPDADPPAG